MKGMRRVFLAIPLLSLISACVALSSNDFATEGVPYFLPRTMVRYVVDQGDEPVLTIDKYQTADKSRPYYLSYNENALSDENVCIDRTKEGLLRRVYFGARDRTSDILLDLVQILAPSNASKELAETPSRRRSCSGTVVSEWMDPYDEVALAGFNRRLCNLRIEIPQFREEATALQVCPRNAVCFSTGSTLNAYLRGNDGTILDTKSESVNSARDIGWITVRGATFNKRITMLDFVDGALTTMRVRKDSETLGLAEFPLKAVERVLAVPGNAIGMAFAGYKERLLYLQQRKALTDAGAVAPGATPTADDMQEVLGCAVKSGA